MRNVLDYGGPTDAAINAAIAASAPGEEIHFPAGTYTLTAPVRLRGRRRYRGEHQHGTILRAAAGASLPALLACETWLDGRSYVTEPLTVEGLTVDGAPATGQPRGLLAALTIPATTAAGIVIHGYRCLLRDVIVVNTPSHGILITDTASDGTITTTTAVEHRIESCRVERAGGHGIYVHNQSGAPKVTDGYILDCIVQAPALSGIYAGQSGGWQVRGNHVYSTGQHGIYLAKGYATVCAHNYVEPVADGYHPIYVYAGDGRATIVADNVTRNRERIV